MTKCQTDGRDRQAEVSAHNFSHASSHSSHKKVPRTCLRARIFSGFFAYARAISHNIHLLAPHEFGTYAPANLAKCFDLLHLHSFHGNRVPFFVTIFFSYDVPPITMSTGSTKC